MRGGSDDDDDDERNRPMPTHATAHWEWRDYLLTRPNVAPLPSRDPDLVAKGSGQVAEEGFRAPAFIDGAAVFWENDEGPEKDVLAFAFGRPLNSVITYKRAHAEAAKAAEKAVALARGEAAEEDMAAEGNARSGL